MVGIYLSGTGNTKHCIEKLVKLLDPSAKAMPLEDKSVPEAIKKEDMIILGYPTQFSNSPYMVRDFIKSHAAVWKNKKVLCVVTMGAFSGDGAGTTARLLKKCGAVILGGLHIKMPDSVCDSVLLKKSFEKNKQIIREADLKIEKTAEKIRAGKYPKNGLSFFARIVGLCGQRLWYYNKTAGYSDKLKINGECEGCGLCAGLCPMNNIVIKDNKAVPQGRCTMCYSCISQCPKQAITLIGKKVQEQYRFEKYV